MPHPVPQLAAFRELDATWPRGHYVRRSEIDRWLANHHAPCDLVTARGIAPSLDQREATELVNHALRVHNAHAAIDGQNRKWLAQQLEVEASAFDASGLTENQRRAILTDADVTLVVAGAGTGKSTTIVHKIDYLVRTGRARPHEILVLAYNKEAQLLLQQRLEATDDASDVRARTFHAFGYGTITQAASSRPNAMSDSDTFQFILATLHRWRRGGDVPAGVRSALGTLASDFVTLEKTQSFASTLSTMHARIRTRRLDRSRIAARASSVRQRAFLTLYAAFADAYAAELTRRAAVDFSDMIVQATDLIEAGAHASRFRYILIDEFQDITPARWHMVTALRRQNPDAALFLVGDDWQSIYAFDDADVGIMTSLPDMETGLARVDLDTTFRFGQDTATATSAFVMRNPNQLRKDIRAQAGIDSGTIQPPRGAGTKDDALRTILDDIVANRPHVASFLILGRYNRCRPDSFDKLVRFGRSHGVRVAFSTCHSAKGLEADEVAIVDLVSGVTGFPSRIPDDEIVDLAPPPRDEFPDGEERRLFYVALTRSRGLVHLLTTDAKRSPFLDELFPPPVSLAGSAKVRAVPKPGRKAASIPVVEIFGRTPHCATCQQPTMIRRDGKNGPFWGCKSFPACWGRPKKCPHCGASAWMLDAPHGARFCGECGRP